MTRYRRGAHEVDAMLFDGSPARAREISRSFGCAVVAGDGSMIEVATSFGRVYIGAGMRVVRDRVTKALSVVDDRQFSAHFQAVEELPAMGMSCFLKGRDFEAQHGWGVV